MNLATIFVVAAVAVCVVVVLFRLHRSKRKGRSCCGCPLSCACKKSSLTLLLSVLLAASLVGCKGQKRNTTQKSSEPVSVVKNTIENVKANVDNGEPILILEQPAYFETGDEESVDDTKEYEDAGADSIYSIVEDDPKFPGGVDSLLAFIRKNQQCPKEMIENGLKGRVVVQFVVEKDGSLSDVRIVRSIASSFSANGYDSELVKPIIPLVDEEAVRLVKSMPKWEPGRQLEERVRVRYFLPIRFPYEPLVKK
jgi:hypothetical protein